MSLALIVHGGAGTIAPARFDAAKSGCQAAALAGWRVLLAGGSALDAVQAAVTSLEDNPSFNAGTGAVLNADGRAQLDAGIMDGRDLQVGAVAGIERIKNPIQLARRVLHSPHVLLVGPGAEQFAEEEDIGLCDPSALVTPTQYAAWQRGYAMGDDMSLYATAGTVTAGLAASHLSGAVQGDEAEAEEDDHQDHGTVGAVAVDAAGCVVAGTSTGGMAAKHPGRVGDTPLVGCGFYAEDGFGGVSSTGHGEHFMRLLLARRAVEYLGAGYSAQAAASAAITLLAERTTGSGGLILLDASGRVGVARNTATMSYAYIVEGMDTPIASI